MAEVTTRRAGEIIRTLFEVLLEAPDGVPPKTAIARVEAKLPLTPFETGEYESTPGVKRFDKILRFMTIGPVKAGWMIKTKSGWILTEAGQDAYNSMPDPEVFFNEAKRRYKEWKRNRPAPEDPGNLSGEIEEEVSSSANLEQAAEEAWTEIDAYLRAMPPYLFQDLVAALLKAMGYHVPWVAPPGKDGGVDVLAYTDPLGATGPRIKVQVKRHTTSKIGVGDLRSFLAVLGSQDVGIFVAVDGFTSDAHNEARAQDNRRLMLIDLERLFDLWVEHYANVAEEDRHLLPLRQVWFLAPSE